MIIDISRIVKDDDMLVRDKGKAISDVVIRSVPDKLFDWESPLYDVELDHLVCGFYKVDTITEFERLMVKLNIWIGENYEMARRV
jgi:hypothetical protein